MSDMSALYSDEDLDYAVSAGAISAEAVRSLRACMAELHGGTSGQADHLRLSSSFADALVAMASALLLGAAATASGADVAWEGGVTAACVAWTLAEFFTRRQRMALTSSLLVLAFVGATFFTVTGLLDDRALRLALAGLAGAVGAAAYWVRFRVPLTMAAGAVALGTGVVAVGWTAAAGPPAWLDYFLLAGGLAVLGWAAWWDRTDPMRLTRRSDAAFWLCGLAAPLLMHLVLSRLGVYSGALAAVQLVPLLAAGLVLALLSLVMDRRVLLASGLACTLLSLFSVLRESGATGPALPAVALVALAAVLLIPRLWLRARAIAVGSLPPAFQRSLRPLR